MLRYGGILRPRLMVGVRGAGLAYDGMYFVETVTHSLKRGEYKQNFTLTRDGQPVTDLEPYLGAAAHVIVVAASDGEFAHTHGEAGSHAHAEAEVPTGNFGPQVSFSQTFAQPGIYKVWGQFSHGGQVITAPFVVEVK